MKTFKELSQELDELYIEREKPIGPRPGDPDPKDEAARKRLRDRKQPMQQTEAYIIKPPKFPIGNDPLDQFPNGPYPRPKNPKCPAGDKCPHEQHPKPEWPHYGPNWHGFPDFVPMTKK